MSENKIVNNNFHMQFVSVKVLVYNIITLCLRVYHNNTRYNKTSSDEDNSIIFIERALYSFRYNKTHYFILITSSCGIYFSKYKTNACTN